MTAVAKNVSLYELSSAYNTLENLLTNPDVEIDDEYRQNLTKAFTEVQGSFNEKIENTVKIIKNFEGQISMVDAEIKRLQERKKVLSNKVEILRDGIKGSMEANGVDKIPSALFVITLGKPKEGSLLINVSPEELPEEYQCRITNIKVNKTLLKEDIKAGVIIEGCSIEQVRPLIIK